MKRGDARNAERRRELHEANVVALATISSPGNWFSGEVRLRQARFAWDTFNGTCERCVACSRSIDDLLTLASYKEHTDPLERLAHVAAHLQDRVSQAWFDEERRCIRDTFSLSSLSDTELHAAFAELIVVAGWSCGIKSFYDSTGLPAPEFPEPSRAAPRRMPLDFVKSIATDARVGFSPFIVELSSQHSQAAEFVRIASRGSDPPYAHVTLAADTCLAWCQWWAAVYIPGNDVLHLFQDAPQSRVLSRPQLETVAAALTGALQCAY